MKAISKGSLVHRPALHYGIIVLALIVLSVFSSLGLARFGYTSILPQMQDSLRLTNTRTGTLQALNLLGYLLTVMGAGMLAARFGPRIVVSTSLLIVSFSMLLTGLVPSFSAACIARFLAGASGAGGNIPAMGLVSAWFGKRRRGIASGIGVTGSSIGLMVTGLLVPAIMTTYGPDGWRVCWYVLAGIGFAVFVLCALFLRNSPHEKGLQPIGQTAPETDENNDKQECSPFHWRSVYASRIVWQLAFLYCAFGFSYIIYATFFVRHLVKEARFSLSDAGALWMSIGFVSLSSGFIWGSLSDRFSRQVALLCVFTLQGISFVILGLSQTTTAVYVSSGLFALTAWSIPALMAALAGDIVGPRLAPAALGLMTIVFGIGQALGPYFAGVIADATQSFSPAFVIAGAVALLCGAGGSLLLREKRLPHNSMSGTP